MVKVTFDYGNKEDHKLVAEMIGATEAVVDTRPAKVEPPKQEKPKPPAPDTPAPEPVKEPEPVEDRVSTPPGEIPPEEVPKTKALAEDVMDFADFQTEVGKKMQAGANVKAALDEMGVPTLSAIEEGRRAEFLASLEK